MKEEALENNRNIVLIRPKHDTRGDVATHGGLKIPIAIKYVSTFEEYLKEQDELARSEDPPPAIDELYIDEAQGFTTQHCLVNLVKYHLDMGKKRRMDMERTLSKMSTRETVDAGEDGGGGSGLVRTDSESKRYYPSKIIV